LGEASAEDEEGVPGTGFRGFLAMVVFGSWCLGVRGGRYVGVGTRGKLVGKEGGIVATLSVWRKHVDKSGRKTLEGRTCSGCSF
jgi:hypothetical protein